MTRALVLEAEYLEVVATRASLRSSAAEDLGASRGA